MYRRRQAIQVDTTCNLYSGYMYQVYTRHYTLVFVIKTSRESLSKLTGGVGARYLHLGGSNFKIKESAGKKWSPLQGLAPTARCLSPEVEDLCSSKDLHATRETKQTTKNVIKSGKSD